MTTWAATSALGRSCFRWAVFVTTSIVWVATLAGPADAHFLGKIKVTGSGGGLSRSVADTGTPHGEDSCTVTGDTWAAASGGSASVEVTSTPASNPCGAQALNASVYHVYVFNGPAYKKNLAGEWKPLTSTGAVPTSTQEGVNCLGDRVSDTRWVRIGDIVVDNNGEGSGGPYPFPSGLGVSDPNRASAICISNGLSYQEVNGQALDLDRGNQAPIILT